MNLGDLRPSRGSKKKRKRVGRGPGSGQGKQAGRGHKGQGARTGGGTRPGFEGGQMPLQRRVPKRGFKSPFKERYALVNVAQLQLFDPGTEVTPELLYERRLVSKKSERVKVLGDGELGKALVVKAHAFSAKAKEKIESSGGKAELIAHA